MSASESTAGDLSLESVTADDNHVLLQHEGDRLAGIESFGKGVPEEMIVSDKYAWDEDLDVQALKRELDEQEVLLDNHGSYLAGNEAELEGMIKMLRSELEGCREQRWRIEEANELADYKDQLLVSMVPPQPPTGAGAGADLDENEESVPGERKGTLDFSELEEINSELDEELSTLMSKLGQVKGEFAELNMQRQRLLEELESFTAEEDELLGSLEEERAALEELDEEKAVKGAMDGDEEVANPDDVFLTQRRED